MISVSTFRAAALVAVTTGLAGCVNVEQVRQGDLQRCDSFGFTRGTDAHAGCMQQMASERQRAMDALRRAALPAVMPAAMPATCVDSERTRSAGTATSTTTTQAVPGGTSTTRTSNSTSRSTSVRVNQCVGG